MRVESETEKGNFIDLMILEGFITIFTRKSLVYFTPTKARTIAFELLRLANKVETESKVFPMEVPPMGADW